MKFSEIAILLPCHSLEDFPLYQEGREAEGLLSAWTALWHPALLAAAERLPTWHRADSPPEEVAGRLFIIPPLCEPQLLAGWANRAHDEGALLVRNMHERGAVVAAALAGLDSPPPVDAALVQDFLALGLCYLLVELLTRQMRYMSNIDEIHLRNQAVAAAQGAVANEVEAARERLRACFDVLTQARERFYPVGVYLIDLVLTAPTTLGPSLRRELTEPTPKNLLISGRLARDMAQQQPESAAVVRQRLADTRLSLVGGEFDEAESPLLPLESILAEFERGRAAYIEALGASPSVYGRRRFGLTPLLPGILAGAGFAGALHFTLDEGQFPRGTQAKTRWEGFGSTAIDAIARVPLDAAAVESALGYPRKMGETMDADHVATLIFAHWPGQVSPFFDDLRRIAAHAPALGKFVTLDEYFRETDRPGDITKFRADQYRAPYLRQAIIREEPDPTASIATTIHQRSRADNVQTLTTLTTLLGGKSRSTGDVTSHGGSSAALDVACQQQAATGLANRLAANGAATGCLVLNPHPFTRREGVCLPALSAPPDVGGAVVAAQPSDAGPRVVVDVPPMGFAWLAAGGAKADSPTKRRSKPPKEPTINNEAVEVTVHPATGGIRAIHDIEQRGNLLSQQLAFRLPPPRPKPGDLWRDPDLDAIYSRMEAESVEVTASGPAFSQIVSRGRLVDAEGARLAGFTQRIELWRGTRLVLIEIELDVDRQPRADAWNSYYACRFAWGDDSAELRRSVGLGSQVTDARNLEAPYFIEVKSGRTRSTILTGGCAYHRRVGQRMLDTLLVARGDTRRRFRLGIGAGIAHSAAAALAFVDPLVVAERAACPKTPTGWLFHLDAKNIVATHWSPLDGEPAAGFRARLCETEGRAGRVHLRCFRPVAAARQIDFRGETVLDLNVAGDQIAIDFAPYEWLEVEGTWTT